MKNPTPYLKMRVLGAIDMAPGISIRDRIRHVSQMPFTDEDGIVRTFTWRTISTWLYRYKSQGVTGMQNKTRSDKGSPRKVVPEKVLEAVEQALPFFRGKSHRLSEIYRVCIERGLLRREEIAPNTFRRTVAQFEMLKPDAEVTNKQRLAFSKEHANEMWQADTMFGPYLKVGSHSVQTKLIAFIDDASRVLCHGEFFLQENIDTLIKALRSALYKRGVPESLYVDNGSIYSSKEITLICARIGCILCHTPVRDGAAKGKIERFFRSVREGFLIRQLDLSSLEVFNRQFIAWVEEEYNDRTHSAIGMKPIDRFGLDLKRIRFLPPNDVTDEFFFMEETRQVKVDNTFSIKNQRFEAPADLRNRSIQVRFDRHSFSKVIVYFKGSRIGQAQPLDPTANDRHPNHPFHPSQVGAASGQGDFSPSNPNPQLPKSP
ncbi:MAG: DDE-type integrase/transposase/recombinase [Nitrospirota bacterium]